MRISDWMSDLCSSDLGCLADTRHFMSVIPIPSQAPSRGARMLRPALGPEIAAWLEDASVIEVMLNPDGRLWIGRHGAGIAEKSGSAALRESGCQDVSSSVGTG